MEREPPAHMAEVVPLVMLVAVLERSEEDVDIDVGVVEKHHPTRLVGP